MLTWMDNTDDAEGYNRYSFLYNLLNAVETTTEGTYTENEETSEIAFTHSWSYADCAKGLDTAAQALNHVAYPSQEVCRVCDGSGALAWTLLLAAMVLIGLQFIALISFWQVGNKARTAWSWPYCLLCNPVSLVTLCGNDDVNLCEDDDGQPRCSTGARADSCLPLTLNAFAILTPFGPYAPHSTRGIIGRFWMLHAKGLVIVLISLSFVAFVPCMNAIHDKVGKDENKNLNSGAGYTCIMLSLCGYSISYAYECLTANHQYQVAAKKWDERESAETNQLMEMELGEMDATGGAMVSRYLAEKWLAPADEVLGPISSMIYKDARALNVIGKARVKD